MKKRVTLTLDEQVVKRVDSLIDGTEIRNRSHAIESLLKQLTKDSPKCAVILIGGGVQSAFQTINNKTILEWQIELLKKHGIKNVILAMDERGNILKKKMGNGENYGVRLTYVVEKKPLGTAGAVTNIQYLLASPFIVLLGHNLIEIDLWDMYSFHKENKSMATVALTTTEKPEKYGVAAMRGNRIVRFVEKPKNPPTKLVNAGVYIFEPEIFNFIGKGNKSFEKDLFPNIAEIGKLFGYIFSTPWSSY